VVDADRPIPLEAQQRPQRRPDDRRPQVSNGHRFGDIRRREVDRRHLPRAGRALAIPVPPRLNVRHHRRGEALWMEGEVQIGTGSLRADNEAIPRPGETPGQFFSDCCGTFPQRLRQRKARHRKIRRDLRRRRLQPYGRRRAGSRVPRSEISTGRDLLQDGNDLRHRLGAGAM